MDDQKHPPVKLTAQYLAATQKPGGLVARGLAAASEAYAETLFRQGMRYRHDDEYGMPPDLDKTYDYLLKAAKLNHAEAQYELENMNSVLGDSAQEWDRTEPGCWLESAVRLGFGPAQYAFAMNHFDFEVSHELPEDEYEQMIEAAFAWYEKRARAGDAEWQFRFAWIHLAGGVDIANRAKGARWLIESAKQDYRPACRRLGQEFLRSAKRSDSTTQQGIYWLTRAVDLGDAYSCRTLGDLYLLGHNGGRSAKGLPPIIAPDKKAAIAWYERGIALGDRSIAYALGALYLNGEHIDQDSHLAEKWLLHAAMEGYDSAKIELGVEYSSGLRLRQDADAAIHWLEQSENRAAGLRLAEIYLEGEIISQNFEAAIKWLTHATDADRPGNQAMKILAKNCFDGRFSTDEESAAQAWLLQMAAKAHELVADMEDSQYPRLNTFHLAELYELGLGVPQDMERAISWYKQSAELGSDGAKTRLRKLGIDWETT